MEYLSFPRVAALDNHTPLLTAHTGGCTLLTKDIQSKQYKVNEKAESENCISVSSERILFLKEIKRIQSLFDTKFAEYKNARTMGLKHTLLVECEQLSLESQRLIDQL